MAADLAEAGHGGERGPLLGRQQEQERQSSRGRGSRGRSGRDHDAGPRRAGRVRRATGSLQATTSASGRNWRSRTTSATRAALGWADQKAGRKSGDAGRGRRPRCGAARTARTRSRTRTVGHRDAARAAHDGEPADERDGARRPGSHSGGDRPARRAARGRAAPRTAGAPSAPRRGRSGPWSRPRRDAPISKRQSRVEGQQVVVDLAARQAQGHEHRGRSRAGGSPRAPLAPRSQQRRMASGKEQRPGQALGEVGRRRR